MIVGVDITLCSVTTGTEARIGQDGLKVWRFGVALLSRMKQDSDTEPTVFFLRTGMSYPEALAMDPAAFFVYSAFMTGAEMLLDITSADMADFARWHGRLWGSMWE